MGKVRAPQSPPAKRPNIAVIAREAGVSVSTVSRFINNTSYVGEQTRRKIRQVIEKYDYRPNFNAQSLARGHARVVGVLATELDNPCTADVIQGVLAGCRQTGFEVLTAYADPEGASEEEMLDLLVRIQSAGIVVLSETGQDSEEFTRRLLDISAERHIPIVLAGARRGGEALDCVTYDSKATGHAATRHLLEHGFEQVGCVTGTLGSLDGRERYDGYRQALIEANIRHDPALVYEGHFRKEDGYRALHHFHAQGRRPRALVCCNDFTALGVLLAAEELGLRIPHDLAVIGCDNIDLTRIVTPKLSTVNFDNRQNGELLARLVFRRIEDPQAARQEIKLKPIIIERDSTRKP